MAKAFVNGEYIDVPDKPAKVYNKPAGPKVKARSGTPTTATPQGRVTTGGKPVRTKVSKPSAKAPRGFSRGSYGLKPATPVPASALGALGGAAGVVGGVEMMHDLTPEGYGTKAVEEQSPRDFNTYQGPLSFMGKVGEAANVVGESIGDFAGMVSTALPESLGGIRQNVDRFGTEQAAPDPYGGMQRGEDFYQEGYGVSPEGYSDLASGRDEMGGGRAAIPSPVTELPPDYMNEAGAGPQQSPISIQDGKVSARYGMPDRPDMSRRDLATRFGDVTGGEIPETMEGFMVANFLQGQLQKDDSRRVGDAKDIYQSDISALPNFMAQDRLREMMPYEQEMKTSQAGHQTALASAIPSQIARNEATALLQKEQAGAVLTKDENKELAIHKQAMADSSKLATEYLKSMGISDPTPEDLSAIADVIYSKRMEAFRQTKSGKTAKLSPRQEEEEGGIFFGEDVPAIPYGVTYE